MGLILGLGTWFYQLGVRDAQTVPVISASTAPIKVRPEDAGGEVTPHQDIASYDAGAAQPVPEPRPQLAEPAPEPTSEDVPVAEPAEPEPEPAQPETTSPEPVARLQPFSDDAPETDNQPGALGAPDGLDEEPEPDATIAVIQPEPEPEAEPEAEPEPVVPPVDEGSELAPVFSPAINRRPQDLRERQRRAIEAEQIDQATLTARAESSRVKIQLRASPSRAEILAAWNRIQSANRDVLGAKALALQTTTSGGTQFFRLRVGPFRNRAEANSVCEALRARGQDCIVTTSG